MKTVAFNKPRTADVDVNSVDRWVGDASVAPEQKPSKAGADEAVHARRSGRSAQADQDRMRSRRR
jgi:hypothetical protein